MLKLKKNFFFQYDLLHFSNTISRKNIIHLGVTSWTSLFKLNQFFFIQCDFSTAADTLRVKKKTLMFVDTLRSYEMKQFKICWIEWLLYLWTLCTEGPVCIQNLARHPWWIKLAFCWILFFLVRPAWYIYITIAFHTSKNSSDVAMCIYNHFDYCFIFRAEVLVLVLNSINSDITVLHF